MATQTGNTSNDSLTGTSGNDTIAGLQGDDTINGGTGDDLLLGNQGNDVITAGDGNNTVAGGMDNDRITVGNGSNLLYGDEGSDTIAAGNGANTIVGGQDSTDGADLITSGSGNDLILGNGGDDTVAVGGGADTVLGGYGNDVILGNQGDDILLGNQGDDTLIGGQGADTLVGGMGNDLLVGGEGDDRALFAGTRASYTITQNAAGDYILTGGDGTDTVSTVEHFQFSDGTFDAAALIESVPSSGSNAGVTVSPPATHPIVAMADSLVASKNNAVTYEASVLLANDTDPNGVTPFIESVTSGDGGTAVLNADNSVSFTPTTGFTGLANFSYKDKDSLGAESNPAVASVTVSDTAPVANNDNLFLMLSNDFEVSRLLSNDTDVNGDGLSISSFTQPDNGTLELITGSMFRYTPNDSGVTSDNFTYKATDGTLISNSASVTLNIMNNFNGER